MRCSMVFFLLLVMALGGCGGSQTLRPAEHYTLEYAPSPVGTQVRLDEGMKVERFSTVRTYSGTAVLYRAEPFSLNAYPDRRWMVSPGDLVTDYLVRDVRHAELFRAVFSYEDVETARYALEGAVTEFFEDRQQAGHPKAVLTVHVTLLDTSQKELSKRIVFQRNYSFSEAFGAGEPAGPARGMSRSMNAFSLRLIRDIQEALKK